MTKILTTIHLSDIQKELLAKVKAAPNPILAHEVISDTANSVDDNFAKAKEVLSQLGIIDEFDNNIEITNKGLEIMTDENIVDETGELTEFGQQLARIDRNEISNNQQQDMSTDMPDAESDQPIGDEEMPPMESLSLIKNINKNAQLLENIKEFNKAN